MTKFLTADEVADAIADNVTIAFPGNLSVMVVDHMLAAIEKRFCTYGHPKGLTVFEPCNAVLGEGTGVERYAHEGMTRRIIASAFPTSRNARITKLIQNGAIEGYNFPMGVLYGLLREIGAGRPGLITKVGLGTFIDPRHGGGKMNGTCSDELVERITLSHQEYLFYRALPIDIALLKATTADTRGNLSLEREPLSLGVLSLAIAAKASGGKVFAQVDRLAEFGSLHPKLVTVPGPLVDGVVLAPDAPQTGVSQFDPTITGETRGVLPRTPVPEGLLRIVLARAAMELRPGWLVNLGVGIPNELPRLLREAECEDLITVSTEHGAFGGLPGRPPAFGTHANPEAIIDPADSLGLYAGGLLDATFLGFAEADSIGNANVTKFADRFMGVGGFVDITARTRRIVLCGSLTAGGGHIAVQNGHVAVTMNGPIQKLVPHVQAVTLNGARAFEQGQAILLITERAVFELDRDGWILKEVAPGIDVGQDIASVIGFPLRVGTGIREWPPEVTLPAGPRFNVWLRSEIMKAG